LPCVSTTSWPGRAAPRPPRDLAHVGELLSHVPACPPDERVAPDGDDDAHGYEDRTTSQIARAGSSVGLRQECGRTARKWIESPSPIACVDAVDVELHAALEHDHELLAGMAHRRRPAVGARFDGGRPAPAIAKPP
jgi:hypothetical protein